jgi:ferredoxin
MALGGQQSHLHVAVLDDKCCGYALCVDAAPELFKLSDEGLSEVVSLLVPEGLEELAEQSVMRCPSRAIVLNTIQ